MMKGIQWKEQTPWEKKQNLQANVFKIIEIMNLKLDIRRPKTVTINSFFLVGGS